MQIDHLKIEKNIVKSDFQKNSSINGKDQINGREKLDYYVRTYILILCGYVGALEQVQPGARSSDLNIQI